MYMYEYATKTLLFGILNENDLKKMKRQSWTIFIMFFYIICKIKFKKQKFCLNYISITVMRHCPRQLVQES